MKAHLKWDQKMVFGIDAAGNSVSADARPPIGDGKAMAPKELLLSALASCTAMDVVALLKKHRQKLDRFEIDVEADLSEGGHPKVFTGAKLTFSVAGEVEPKVVLESVIASQTRFCGVSAMLSRAFPISYDVFVNGELVGSGSANFDAP
jgi:putative redox protein